MKLATEHRQIEQPSLPRKRKRPNYSILQYVEGHQSAEGHHPLTVEDRCKSMYYEAIDAILQAIMKGFDQSSFKAQYFLQ